MLTRSSVDLPPPHRPGRYPAREQRLGAVRLANPRVHHDAQRLICHLRYLLEHGLKADGRPDPDAKDLNEGGSFETFFTETGNGKYVPRSIFVDLDPSVRCIVYAAQLEANQLSPSTRSVLVPTASCSTLSC